ncbi:GNAT family N-acetyltransferase [Paenibacillus sp. sptzw28]|uniref:GNAT family N-acetyltransferase n=1 Tax=Paenibacillus sp. sptzw28 TaxID=715179 RepID=UPI001C6ED068|nr:GNAT family N-acetyltransferase [Paenibacillus sp. sptzw28]QYR23498.1 GNAT family N-acetyltransferase [Paenibacillus sp. sptzw28]
MRELKLVDAAPDNTDLARLIKKLDEDLLQRYPADEIFGVDFDDPNINEVAFIIAYSGEIPVGCGAIRPIDDDSTELKRFFVEREYRNKGIAKQILSALEAKAKGLGFNCIRLEAGTKQPEALSFYIKHGYYEIDKFGEYIECESSLCYEKRI